MIRGYWFTAYYFRELGYSILIYSALGVDINLFLTYGSVLVTANIVCAFFSQEWLIGNVVIWASWTEWNGCSDVYDLLQSFSGMWAVFTHQSFILVWTVCHRNDYNTFSSLWIVHSTAMVFRWPFAFSIMLLWMRAIEKAAETGSLRKGYSERFADRIMAYMSKMFEHDSFCGESEWMMWSELLITKWVVRFALSFVCMYFFPSPLSQLLWISVSWKDINQINDNQREGLLKGLLICVDHIAQQYRCFEYAIKKCEVKTSRGYPNEGVMGKVSFEKIGFYALISVPPLCSSFK